MISLYSIPNLNQIANEHYKSVEEYAEFRATNDNKLDALNTKIAQCFGEKYNLEKLVLAKPSELQKLVSLCKKGC